MKYTNEQLINHICEKSFRSSEKNRQKLANCGITEGEKMPLGNNCFIVFNASHGGIRKTFLWGTREVSRETVLRRCEA